MVSMEGRKVPESDSGGTDVEESSVTASSEGFPSSPSGLPEGHTKPTLRLLAQAATGLPGQLWEGPSEDGSPFGDRRLALSSVLGEPSVPTATAAPRARKGEYGRPTGAAVGP
eukprot:RCo000880